jgi:hypothetical protein
MPTKRKSSTPPLKEFSVPFRLTLEGALTIQADAEAAYSLAQSGEWDDDTFFSRAEHVDWRPTGRAKEIS